MLLYHYKNNLQILNESSHMHPVQSRWLISIQYMVKFAGNDLRKYTDSSKVPSNWTSYKVINDSDFQCTFHEELFHTLSVVSSP